MYVLTAVFAGVKIASQTNRSDSSQIGTFFRLQCTSKLNL